MTQKGENRSYTQPISLLLILLVVASLFIALVVARQLGLSRSDPSMRLRYHALPVAISQVYHGRKHDYTAYWSVAMQFYNETPLAEAIQRAISQKPPPEDRTYYWTADDRGLSDFVNIGFRLFGPSIPALFYYWFLLYGVTVFLAIVRFRRDSIALAVVACAVMSFVATLPALTRAASSDFAEASIHLTESRMFDLLAAVAAVHLLLVMFRPPSTPRWLDVGTTVLQAGLIAGCIHARTSVSYLFLALLALALFLIFLRWKEVRKNLASSPITQVLLIIVVMWTGVHVYQHIMLNKTYRGDIGPRTFWHNVLMGLGANAELAKVLKVEISDKSAVDAVVADMKERNDPRFSEKWQTQNILDSFGGQVTFDWQAYEQVARDLVIRTLIAHPGAAVKLIFWDKPVSVYYIISCRYLAIYSACTETDARQLNTLPSRGKFIPLIWLGLLLMAIVSYFFERRRERGPVRPNDLANVRGLVLALLFLAFVGLAPSIIVYTGVTQLGGSFVFALTAISFWLIAVVQQPLERLYSRRSLGMA